MEEMYEVVFKCDRVVVLTMNNFSNWTSAMEVIQKQKDEGIMFDTAEIFEVRGRSRYLVNKEIILPK